MAVSRLHTFLSTDTKVELEVSFFVFTLEVSALLVELEERVPCLW